MYLENEVRVATEGEHYAAAAEAVVVAGKACTIVRELTGNEYGRFQTD